MRYKLLAVLLPCALALSACTTVTPAYKDNGTRSGPCVEGGPDDVAQKFYDTQIQNRTQDPAALRPYLSDGLAQLLNDARQDPAKGKLLQANPFSSSSTPADSAVVASASTIPNRDARNIPLRVELKQGTQSWKDEVLMIQEGQCWAVDDVRYLGNNSHAPAGTLRQSLEKR
ncbi:lipoprotein [Klebsiella variicola]|uniref:lipoprotein n=1 Tax=Klebsiella variicola TaxID=244366 RepID=UPI003D28B336